MKKLGMSHQYRQKNTCTHVHYLFNNRECKKNKLIIFEKMKCSVIIISSRRFFEFDCRRILLRRYAAAYYVEKTPFDYYRDVLFYSATIT